MLPTIPLNAGAPLDFEAIRLRPVTAHSITLQTPGRKRDVGCLDCLEMGTYDSTDLRGCTGWRRGRPRILRPNLVERSVARKGGLQRDLIAGTIELIQDLKVSGAVGGSGDGEGQ